MGWSKKKKKKKDATGGRGPNRAHKRVMHLILQSCPRNQSNHLNVEWARALVHSQNPL